MSKNSIPLHKSFDTIHLLWYLSETLFFLHKMYLYTVHTLDWIMFHFFYNVVNTLSLALLTKQMGKLHNWNCISKECEYTVLFLFFIKQHPFSLYSVPVIVRHYFFSFARFHSRLQCVTHTLRIKNSFETFVIYSIDTVFQLKGT